MGVYLKWEEPKEFAKKKRIEYVRSASKFFWKKIIIGLFFGGSAMLIWYLGIITQKNDPDFSPISFWAALSVSIGIALLLPIALHVIETKCSPPTIRIRIGKRGIKLLDNNRNRIWRFGDIADFHITKEQVGELFVNAINLKDFDGVAVSVGISPEINIDVLQAVLLERIYAARERIKCSYRAPKIYWAEIFGVLMVILGFLVLIMVALSLFDTGNHVDEVSFIKDDLKQIKEQYGSGNPTELQEKAFNKVAAKAYFAMHYAIKRGVSQLLLLVGSVGTGILLLGFNLVLWARNRRIYNRMRRLEVMCLELQTSQNQTKP
jgi:hypothetical protein